MSESDRDEIRRQAEMAGEEKLQVVLNFMIAREDGLRFTTYPRLVLETTMIKLCSLGDYLSFGDIMKKIAILEERVVSLSPGQPRENGKTLSEAPSGWSPNDKEVTIGEVDTGETPTGKEKIEEFGQADLKDPSDPSANGEKTWEDFLQFVFGKSKMFYTVLKDWHLKELTEDLLEIENGNHKFSSGYFEEQEKLDQLAGYCRMFFERDIRVKIGVKPQESNLEEDRVSNKNKNTSATESSELPPEVRDVAKNVLDLFEGKLINKQ